MRFLKPTPTPLNGEATKPTRNAKQKGKARRPIHNGEKNVNENHRHITWKGGGRGENVSMKKRKPKVAPPPQRGGARRDYTTEKEKNHIVLFHSRSGKTTQNAPGPEGGGRQDEKENDTKLIQSCASIERPD